VTVAPLLLQLPLDDVSQPFLNLAQLLLGFTVHQARSFFLFAFCLLPFCLFFCSWVLYGSAETEKTFVRPPILPSLCPLLTYRGPTLRYQPHKHLLKRREVTLVISGQNHVQFCTILRLGV
jgi:hypothetical protein